jgi:putative membrane protein
MNMRTLVTMLLGIAAAAAAGCSLAPLLGGAGHGGPEADQAFLESAAHEGLAEVRLGELAVDKTSDARVKTLARAVRDDFEQTNAELHALAAAKGIALPAGLDGQEQRDYRDLARLCCSDFNRYYVNMMAEYHVRDVRRFRSELRHTADPELRRFAAANLRLLKDHREQAQTLMPYFGLGRTYGGDVAQ